MRLFSPTMHTVVDYLFCLLVAALPSLVPMPPAAESVAYWFASAYFVVSPMTNTSAGLLPVIPFKVHGALEIPGAIFLAASPWMFGFADHAAATNVFLMLAAGVVLAFLLTDWSREPFTGRTVAT